MPETIIRQAALSDLPTLLKFEQGVISAERPFDSTLKNGEIRYYDLEAMITAKHIYLVMAELNGELIGSGYARIEDAKPYLQHPQHAYLGFMYTLPEHRGKGVNQEIISVLKDWAETQNITELRLDVYHENKQAIRAYAKAGFARHMVEMRRSVGN